MGAFDIQGNNCVFQLKVDDVYKTVVCAKSFTFNPITDMKETTTVGSGFWKEFRPRKLSYTITFNGMLQVESLNTQERIKTMFDYQIGFLPLPYRIIYTDNSSNVMVVEGWVYVTSTLLDASPVNLVNGTIELQGNGMPTISDVIPDLANIHIVSLGDNSINAQFQFKLMDSTGAIVFDSGQLPGASGGNLTHPVDITGTVQKGTYFIFWQALAQSIGNAFQLDAPPTKSEIFNSALVNESTYGIQDFDFTANRTVTFTLGVSNPPPSCVAPSVSFASVPDGLNGNSWTGTITVAGSQPFNLTNITKPSWMSISVNNDTITMTGTAQTGSGQTISFDINNACGSVSYSTTIDILSNPGLITVNYNYTEPGSGLGAGCSFVVYKNSAEIASLSITGSSSFSGHTFDAIEARVFGPAFANKEIHVIDSIDGEIASDITLGAIATVMFTLTAGHVYTINATATNV